MRDKLREQFIFENPSAAKERIDAGVFRMVYEHHVKEAKPQSVTSKSLFLIFSGGTYLEPDFQARSH